MNRFVVDWLWRMAILCALGVIGWELQRLHADITQPVDDQTTVAGSPDAPQDSLDAIREDLGLLTQKVDAILVVMARSK